MQWAIGKPRLDRFAYNKPCCQLIAPNDLVDDQNLHWIYDDSDVCDVGNDVTKIKLL